MKTDKQKSYIEKKHHFFLSLFFFLTKKGGFQTNFNSTCSPQLWCMIPFLAKKIESEQCTAVRLPGQHELYNRLLSA